MMASLHSHFSTLVALILVSGQGLVHSKDLPPERATEELSVVESIRKESLQPVTEEDGYPLPLTSTWNTGIYGYTWTNRPRGADPAWQIEQIEKGHYFLPTFNMPGTSTPGLDYGGEQHAEYFYPPLEKVKAYNLPFTLLGSQWESILTGNPEFFDLPPDENPNVVTPEGEILKMVDPFGPTDLWYQAGKQVTTQPQLLKAQKVYPNPPKVIFLSNNEHAKLMWPEVEKSRRYLERYGKGKPDHFKRKVVGDAWIEKYQALQRGMRDGLVEENWKKNAIFVGYGGDVGMDAMGRWGNWAAYSLHSPGRISIAPYMWDGVSPSYYMHYAFTVSDYQVNSNQIEAMNNVFALEEAYKINPNFWYELSTWDGDAENEARGLKSKLSTYREAGQTYDMARFRGWFQFGQWLLRPRVLRAYEDWTPPLEEYEETFENMMLVVDRVHHNKTLRRYWRHGELVANRQEVHPYQMSVPNAIMIQPRWFLLDADINPERPWKLDTEIPVFSLALKLRESPNRSWLVYAHAPLRDYQDVTIQIPDWQPITIDVPREGAFYEVREADGSITEIKL